MPTYYRQPLNFYSLSHGAEYLCPQRCENKKYDKAGYCKICEKKLIQTVITCTLKDSIAQRLHLILITNLNECRYDRQFGNVIWDHDFENITNINTWKDKMAKAVKEVIEKFEPRLFNIRTTLDLTEEEFVNKEQKVLKKIKKRVEIKIEARLKKTNEEFFFRELLYVSPLWID